jgi:AcrR family transcriptional regulator
MLIFERTQTNVKRSGGWGWARRWAVLENVQRFEGPVHDSAVVSLGQRERNKRDKLLRIKNAAQDLFVSKGYDDTTTREIAVQAGVGMGTVFTYAANKRDLLFLIANEYLEETTAKAEREISPGASLMENLLAIFRNHYEYFAQQPELSRLMLREMLFYDSGQQANRFQTIRERVIALVCRSVEFAKQNKTIGTTEDSRQIGWMLFCIYQVEIRGWLSEGNLNLKDGLERLAHLLRTCLAGVAPQDAALALSDVVRRERDAAAVSPPAKRRR